MIEADTENMDPGATIAAPGDEIAARRSAIVLARVGEIEPLVGLKSVARCVAAVTVGADEQLLRIPRMDVDRAVEAPRWPGIR